MIRATHKIETIRLKNDRGDGEVVLLYNGVEC